MARAMTASAAKGSVVDLIVRDVEMWMVKIRWRTRLTVRRADGKQTSKVDGLDLGRALHHAASNRRRQRLPPFPTVPLGW